MKARSLTVALFLSVAASLPAAAQASGTAKPAEKRYHLEGKIVSIQMEKHQAVIDAKAITGYMGPMAMPYTFKDSVTLSKLKAGNQISGDLVMSGGKSWLENVKATADSMKKD